MSGKLLIFVMVFMAVFSCNEPGKKAAEPSAVVNKDTVSFLETKEKDTATNPQQKFVLQPGSDTFTVQLHIAEINDRKIIPITIKSGNELFAIVHKANKKANIRINQVEMPDSTFDGPFGDSLQYKLKMPGTYKIIVGQNLMAEGKPFGDFTLKAWVK